MFQLKTGEIEVNGKKVNTSPLSSVVKAMAIVEILKISYQRVSHFINNKAELLPDGQS